MSGPALTLLTTSLVRGGSETQVVRLACGLRARGWRVDLICLSGPGSFAGELADGDVPVLYLGLKPGRPRPTPFFRLLARLQSTRPDVLACFMVHANLVGRVVGRLARVPVIVTSIRNERFGGRLRELAERITAGLGDLVTTNSERVAEDLIRRGIIRREQVEVIPNGYTAPAPQSPHAREQLHKTLTQGAQAFLWLAVGSFEKQKDHSNLLRALVAVKAEVPAVNLAIAGEGSLLARLRAEAEQLGVADSVALLGLRHDIPALIEAADGFVHSSAWEGLPNAVLEATVAGAPVVATEVGGVGEIIESGVNGFLVPPCDPEALASAMLRMMRLPAAERARMGSVKRDEIAARHGLPHVLDRWEALFVRLRLQVVGR
jgi:glycosyltransferase involved in cell wall biosynthesis